MKISVSRLMFGYRHALRFIYIYFFIFYKYFMYSILDFIHYSILLYFKSSRILVC
jgi:hypothetical protein